MTFTTDEVGKAPEQQRLPAEAAPAVERLPQKVAAAQANGHPVPASPATWRLAMELGVDLQAVPASGPGGRVMAEDVGGPVPAPARARQEAATEAPEGRKPRQGQSGP